MSTQNIIAGAEKVRQIPGLTTSLVGVKFIFNESEIPDKIGRISGHRYCQALMKATNADNSGEVSE